MVAIYNLPPNEFAPVMLLTEVVSEESREAAIRAGAHNNLTTSFDPIEVALRVSNVSHQDEIRKLGRWTRPNDQHPTLTSIYFGNDNECSKAALERAE